MIELDDSEFTQDHRDYLNEWANNLGVTVAVLVGRIVLACTEGELYIEDAPDLRPD